jgi:hypothetical protein
MSLNAWSREAYLNELQQHADTFGEFCTIFAQGLRTHLTTIRGYTELMQTNFLDDNPEHTIKAFKNSTAKIYAMIDAMMDYAQFVEKNGSSPISLLKNQNNEKSQ